MRGIIIEKIGPYDGPYENNLITYKIKIGDGRIIAWHENGKRGLIASKGDVIKGLILINNIPNYNKSKIINVQLKLEL